MGEAGLCWVSDVLALSSSGDTGFSSNNCKEQLWFSRLFKKRAYSVDILNISCLLNPLLALDSFYLLQIAAFASIISCFVYIRLITVILAINFF